MIFGELALVGGILIGGILVRTEGPRFQAVYHIFRNAPGQVRELDGNRGPVQIEGRAVAGAEGQSDEQLAAADATAALAFLRDSPAQQGKPINAFLELAWHTGARLGGLRGLDLEDYHADEQFVAFTHRPDTDTPLKNKERGERLVGLND